jgi:peptidoglycan hydrolase-like protein with peptidoglycan-binding domain
VEAAGDYVCHAGIASLPDLRRGSPSGSDVEALQVVLDQLGYSPGPLDGQFGRRTEAAVRAFQADHQLAADGLVGPLTWTAIVNAYCA